MFLNSLKILASNYIKTFLKIIVITVRAYICYFQFAKTNRKHIYAILVSCTPGRQEIIE